MRKNLLFLLCMLLTVFTFSTGIFAADAWDGSVDTSWYKADQTSFEISNGKELAGLAAIVNGNASGITKSNFEGKTITLTADIDLGNKEWTSISTSSGNSFKGVFNGDGKTISNLRLKSGTGGLFGFNYGTIKNLTIKSDKLTEKACTNQGAFVKENYGIIVSCLNYANTEGSYNGGIASKNWKNAYIVACANFGNVSVTGNSGCVGGIVGSNLSGYIHSCYNKGTISGKYAVGGIAGEGASGSYQGIFINCYNAGVIDCTNVNYGGIAGYSFANATANNIALSTDTFNKGVPAMGAKTPTEAQAKNVDEATLKGAAATLGGFFTADKEGDDAINDGYPIFPYQSTGKYTDESEGLAIDALEVSNGSVKVTLNKSLTYTKLTAADFVLSIDNAETVINSASLKDNVVTLNFTALPAETKDRTYLINVALKDANSKLVQYKIPAFSISDFEVENGKFSGAVDASITTASIPLNEFTATIAKNGGKAEPLTLKRRNARNGTFFVTYDKIGNLPQAAEYTVTLQYKDSPVYSGSFTVEGLKIASIDSFDNPTLTYGLGTLVKTTKGTMKLTLSTTPVVAPTAADFKVSYLMEVNGDFEAEELTIDKPTMSGNVATIKFQRIPLQTEAKDVIIKVSYKGGDQKSYAYQMPVNRNWSAYAEKPTIGNGSKNFPYRIGTAEELAWFAALVNGSLEDGTAKNLNACAVLTADIQLNDTSDWETWDKDREDLRIWRPIGSQDTYMGNASYRGTFDGRGYTISGLYCAEKTGTSSLGFFNDVTGATVKNLKIEKSYFYNK